MGDIAVSFDQVWKSYPSYTRLSGGIKSVLFHPLQTLRELRQRRTALEDVSFTIQRGECFGFIGRNGAGKSTTLGLIAGVLSPDSGAVTVNGRVSPLLELGSGFHPELTGRENILLNGVLMGVPRAEVLALEEEIIAFSELGEFIDQPVRTYSSGMQSKLGFSVVSILKPEILLLDEVWAVGDLAFTNKCEAVFEKFRQNPKVTIIMVSHGLASVAKTCDRAVWIEGKNVKMLGAAKEVVQAYEAMYSPVAEDEETPSEEDMAAKYAPAVWPAKSTVRVVARNIMPRDAVGNFAVSVAEQYAQYGVPARLYAHFSHPELAALVAPLDDLHTETKASDTLFYHFSTEDEFLPEILSLPWARKILYYHNVTPGNWFRDEKPDFADVLDRAREQFSHFADFDAVFANSQYSLNEILPHARPDAAHAVCPPRLDPERLAKLLPEPIELPHTKQRILWVGRFAPHKRPELALALFARLAASMPDTILIMVSGPRRDFTDYAARVDAHIAALPEDNRSRVILLENLPDQQLAWLYRHCSLLLCTSGHEGYCLPLAEAMSFGLPVAAFPQEAVEETLDGYGTILPEDTAEAAAVLAELLASGIARKQPVQPLLPERGIPAMLLRAESEHA